MQQKVVVFHDTKYCFNAFIKALSWSIYSFNDLTCFDISLDYLINICKTKNKIEFFTTLFLPIRY